MLWASLLGRSSVVALCYHNIGGNGVPWEAFAAQMRWLKRAGVEPLSQAGLRRFLSGVPRIRPGVMLTFDDGFRDLYTRVRPLLLELNFSALVFVINNRVRPDDEPGVEGEITAHRAHEAFLRRGDRSAWMSWTELRTMMGEGILEVGSHSLTHAMAPVTRPLLDRAPDHWSYAPYVERNPAGPFPYLAPELSRELWLADEDRLERLDDIHARALQNLRLSRQELEWQLGAPVHSLAWPWGQCHPQAARAAREAGLDLQFTLRRGPVTQGSPLSGINRLEVRRTRGQTWFRSRMALYSRAWAARLYSAARIG